MVAKIQMLRQPDFRADALNHCALLSIIGPCISPLCHGCAWQVHVVRKKQVDYLKSKGPGNLSSTWNSVVSLWPLRMEDLPYNTFPQETFY